MIVGARLCIIFLSNDDFLHESSQKNILKLPTLSQNHSINASKYY